MCKYPEMHVSSKNLPGLSSGLPLQSPTVAVCLSSLQTNVCFPACEGGLEWQLSMFTVTLWFFLGFIVGDRQADKQAGRQICRQTGSQANKNTGR